MEKGFRMGLPCRERSVCVVDGDADSRCALVGQLQAHGLTALAFESAEAFLESHDRIQAGCLILELNLPGMNGLALQRCLNQLQISLPLIFIASSADVASAVSAIQNGAVDFLRKGPDSSRLIAVANRLVTAIRAGRPAPWRRHPYAPPTDCWRNIRQTQPSNSAAFRSLQKHVE
jgi:FixJ family two-component response regulator